MNPWGTDAPLVNLCPVCGKQTRFVRGGERRCKNNHRTFIGRPPRLNIKRVGKKRSLLKRIFRG